jgi:hypothetical protein
MNERRTNVYENKGSLWKTCPQSGNLYENKGGYRSRAGMLLKTKGLRAGGWELDEYEPGSYMA